MSKYFNSLLTFVLICLFIFNFNLVSQNNRLIFEKLSSENGLSQNSIYSIVQDKDGFLWFATDYGLNRFDAYAFSSYFSEYNNNNSLWDNKIQDLYIDRYGDLWIATGKGLNRLDKERQRMDRIQLPHNINKSILALNEDKNGDLWIGTARGILALKKDSDNEIVSIKQFGQKSVLSNSYINRLFEDNTGIIWVCTKEGLYYFNRRTDRFNSFNSDSSICNIEKLSITSIFEDSRHTLWIGTRDFRLFKKLKNRTVFEEVILNSNEFKENCIITSIFEDNFNNIWFGTYGCGLYKLDQKTSILDKFNSNSQDINSISSNHIFSVKKSSDGIIWIGTVNGLNKLDLQGNKFNHWDLDEYKGKYPVNNNIWGIFKDIDHLVWLGTESGVFKFMKKKNKFIIIPDMKMIDKRVIAITSYSGKLWFGTDRSGLFSLNKLSREVMTYTSKMEYGLKGKSVYTLFQDDKLLWLGTDSGLSSYNKKSNRFNYRQYQKILKSSIIKRGIYSIYKDKVGILWAGGESGLFFIDGSKKVLRRKALFANDLLSELNEIIVLFITEGKDGILYIGSDSGLICLNKERKLSKLVSIKHGLPGNDIYGIIEDSQGDLWISTNNGIAKFNPHTGKSKNFNKYDGLQSKEFNSGSCFKASDGEFFFGGVNGFNSFYPSRIRENEHIPNINITSIKIFDREIETPYVVNKSGEICFNYDQNFISFEFTALDYTTPEKNRYAFRMVGVDKEWAYRNSDRRFANYTDLSSGHYTFRVKGSNNDGVWNEEGASVKIYISPPFWRTWWAYLSYVFFIFLFFLIGHKVRVRQLKKRKRELVDEVDRRTTELEKANIEINIINSSLEKSMLDLSKMNSELREANMLKSEFLGIAAHDLKNPLQVILGYTDILRMKLKKEDQDIKEILKINKSVEKMLELITELLKAASIESGQLKLNMERIDLAKLIGNVVEANRTISTKKDQKIIYSQETGIFISGDYMKIMQIFDNLISNGIKYSPLSKDIVVTIGIDKSMAIVQVEDHGPGFSEQDKKNLFKKFQRLSAKPTAGESSTGLGLSICKGFVERHNGEIYVESESGKGSVFTVKLPLIN